MAVKEIWDISPSLFSINFEITLADARGDFKIDKTRQVYNGPRVVKIIAAIHKQFLVNNDF